MNCWWRVWDLQGKHLEHPASKVWARNATKLKQFMHRRAMLKNGKRMTHNRDMSCVAIDQSCQVIHIKLVNIDQYCISHDWDLSLQRGLPYVSILELVKWTLAASPDADKDPCTSRCYQLIFRILGHPSKYVAISANCLRFLRFVKSPKFGPINPGM